MPFSEGAPAEILGIQLKNSCHAWDLVELHATATVLPVGYCLRFDAQLGGDFSLPQTQRRPALAQELGEGHTSIVLFIHGFVSVEMPAKWPVV